VAQEEVRASPQAEPVPLGEDGIRFAVIGDYGDAGVARDDVANLVRGWDVDFVLTLGDNNYPVGSASTIDANIGAAYHAFIHPYQGSYGEGADKMRFFPSLGNHDWARGDIQAHLDYFALPGNERYYSFTWGPASFFAVDSDPHEPDGVTADSVQATWLREALAASDSPFNVVYMHHPPYSSGRHGSQPGMQWPFKAWGADLVMAGHDHTYERIRIGDLTYVVNGLGGRRWRYRLGAPIEGSQFRYNSDFGAMRVVMNETQAVIEFVDKAGTVVDRFGLTASGELWEAE
jgi:hypothetical protein